MPRGGARPGPKLIGCGTGGGNSIHHFVGCNNLFSRPMSAALGDHLILDMHRAGAGWARRGPVGYGHEAAIL